MDPAFSESFINGEHSVLGKTLHPFCLEDAFFLSVAESPFLLPSTDTVKYDWADLSLAVEICSTRGPELSKQLKAPSVREIRSLIFEHDLTDECQKFVDYIDDYFAPPLVWSEGEGQLGTHWTLAHIVLLMRHFNISEREAWEMPLGKALWFAAAITEQTSTGLQVVSEDEAEGMRALGIK